MLRSGLGSIKNRNPKPYTGKAVLPLGFRVYGLGFIGFRV